MLGEAMSRKTQWGLVLTASIFLAACERPDWGASEAEAGRLVTLAAVEAPAAAGVRRYAARIAAGRRADLSFRVPGTVQKLLFKEGDIVEEGQVVAELDPTQYRNVVKERQATFDSAAKDFERARELLRNGNISQRDYDQVQARYKTTEAALDEARTDLSYTVLKAPFRGDIAARAIEQFEEVQARQPVLALRDTSVLDVKFGIPESAALYLGQSPGGADPITQIAVFADFEKAPGKRYPLTFKEAATKADPKTQTFELTYQMPAPEDIVVLPGMTANVEMDLTEFLGGTIVYNLPVEAVVADNELNARAWVLDEQTMTVASRPVSVGVLVGDRIAVTGGLQEGEQVVVGGAAYLSDGMRVRPLAGPPAANAPGQDDGA